MTATPLATEPEAAEWVACSHCHSVVYVKRFDRQLRVCAECGSHERLTATERSGQLFDPGKWDVVDLDITSSDHLGFVDSKPYTQRIDEARERTGMRSAVLCVRG